MRLPVQLSRGPQAPIQRAVQCRMGGPNFGGDMGAGQPPKLIIPGQQGGGAPSRPGGGLVLPGGPGGNPGGGLGAAPAEPVAVRNFRPPPGFMDAEGVQSYDTNMSPQEMLNKLQAQAGHWHQLAKLLPALQAKGFDAFAVEEATGLERKTQNLWTSSSSIYDALSKSGLVAPEILSYYDTPGCEVLLHELRFLSLRQRAAAVAYIAENRLDDAECTILARAIKEHERRNGFREGFTDSPKDCLAYKYYRDALECRRKEDAESCAQKGLALVETEEGRAKLLAISSTDEETAQSSPAGQASLTVLRLEREEVGCRPIAHAGNLVQAVSEKVRSAPKVSSEGVFTAFTIPADGAEWEWIPLPAWPIISLSGKPVALSVTNCGDLESLRATVNVKSEESIRKLQGPGMLVVDLEPATKNIDAAAYYLVESDNGGVEVAAGGAIADESKVVGPVLFLCRPPQRDSAGSSATETPINI